MKKMGADIVQLFWPVHIELAYRAVPRFFGKISANFNQYFSHIFVLFLFTGPWSNKKSDLKIEEGPSPGQLVVNGKTVQVTQF